MLKKGDKVKINSTGEIGIINDYEPGTSLFDHLPIVDINIYNGPVTEIRNVGSVEKISELEYEVLKNEFK